METREFERLARLEQIQTDSIKAMDAHVAEDHRMLDEIRGNIQDIYEKISSLLVAQTELKTIMRVMGWIVMLLTPVITAIVVVILEIFFIRK